MGVLSWAIARASNAFSDPTIPAQDGASVRQFMDMIRGLMSAARALADDQGGAVKTTGTANAYAAVTASGIGTLRQGLSVVVRVDRTNTGAASLNVDGTGPVPWRTAGNRDFATGELAAASFVRVYYDETLGAWISTTLPISVRGRLMRLTAAPSATDLALDEWALVWNAAEQRFRLVVNDRGTVIDAFNGQEF